MQSLMRSSFEVNFSLLMLTRGKRKGAKFCEGSFVRADWLCIGYLKLVCCTRNEGNSNREHFFCMDLYNLSTSVHKHVIYPLRKWNWNDWSSNAPKIKAGRVYKPYEGSISVDDKKEVLRKYDELKLKELTLDKAAEQGWYAHMMFAKSSGGGTLYLKICFCR